MWLVKSSSAGWQSEEHYPRPWREWDLEGATEGALGGPCLLSSWCVLGPERFLSRPPVLKSHPPEPQSVAVFGAVAPVKSGQLPEPSGGEPVPV